MSDQYWNQTTALLHFDGVNGGKVILNSAAGSSCGAFGTAALSTTQKKFGNTALWLDGSAGYVEFFKPEDFHLGTSNFTIEGWLWLDSSGSGARTVIDKTQHYPSNTVDFRLEVNSANQLAFCAGPTPVWFGGTAAQAIATNVWTHFAVVRNAGNLLMFINGVLVSTQACSFDAGNLSSAVAVGATSETTGRWNKFKGYIDELRVTVGVPRYTATFTLATDQFEEGPVASYEALRSYPDNVSLLMNLSGVPGAVTFDDDAFNFNPMVVGTPVLSNARYYLGESSLYLNGASHLQLPANSLLRFSGDFTVEFWVLLPSTSGTHGLIGNNLVGASSGGHRFGLYVRDGVLYSLIYDLAGGPYNSELAVGVVVPDTWTHVVLTFKAGFLRHFVDGRRGKTYQTGVVFDANTDWVVGGTGLSAGVAQNKMTGYLSGLCVTKGVSCTEVPFVPPISLQSIAIPTDPHWAFVRSICHPVAMPNASAFKDSYGRLFVSANTGVLSSAVKRFNNPVIDLRGNSETDYVSFDTIGPDFNLLNADSATVEMWINPSAVPTQQLTLVTNHEQSAYKANWAIRATASGVSVEVGAANSSSMDSQQLNVATFALDWASLIGTWVHVAMVKAGASVQLFVNGIGGAVGTITKTMVGASAWFCFGSPHGTGAGSGHHFRGYISEFRFTKGVVRYTENFAVPSKPFYTGPMAAEDVVSSVSKTQCLLHFDGDDLSKHAPDHSRNRWPSWYGAAALSTAQKRFGSASLAVNGDVGTYLQVSGLPALGDCVISAWVYLTTYTSNGSLFRFQPDSTNMSLNESNCYACGTPTGLKVSQIIPLGVWTHVAQKRVGSTGTLYINGIVVWVGSANTTNSASSLQIGGAHDLSGINGYIDEVRVLSAATGDYAVPFIPASSQFADPLITSADDLPANWSSCVLLSHANGVQADAFAVDHAKGAKITAIGTAVVSSEASKFGGTSLKLVNAGDAFSMAPTDMQVTAGQAYTLECWFKPTSWVGLNMLFGYYGDSVGRRSVGFSSGSLLVSQNANGTLFSGSAVIPLNVWHHFVMCCDGTTTYVFINGWKAYSGASALAFGSGPANFLIGSSSNGGNYNESFRGYIDEVRFLKGVCAYTDRFHPPTVPFKDSLPKADDLTSDLASTVLLLHGAAEHANSLTYLRDFSTYDHCVRFYGTGGLSSTQTLFSTHSMYFNGADTYADVWKNGSVDMVSAAVIGTGDFTVEMGVWVDPAVGGWTRICETEAYNSANPGWHFSFNGSDAAGKRRIGFQLSATSNGPRLDSDYPLPTGRWVHLAVVRSGGVFKMFIDGVVQSTTLANAMNLTNTKLRFGATTGTASNFFKGYVAEFKLTKLARYTSNFVPPTKAHPDDSDLWLDADFTKVKVLLPLNGHTDTFYDLLGSTLTKVGVPPYHSAGKFGCSSGSFNDLNYLTLNAALVDVDCSAGFGAYTVEFWFCPDSSLSTGSSELLGTGKFGGTSGWAITFYQNTLVVNMGASSMQKTLSWVAGQWYHIALTYSNGSPTAGNGVAVIPAGTLKLYVDGVLQVSNSSNITGTSNNVTLYIGGGSNGFSSWLNHRMDDIRITKGLNRYYNGVTVPTRAHPTRGLGSLSGVVKDAYGVPCARTVRSHRRSDGALIDQTTSNATTGAFTIKAKDLTEHMVIVLDPSANAIIFDHILPV